jgi:hypothetical protein
MTCGSHEPTTYSSFQRAEAAWDRKKKESDQISGAKNNPWKETFIVHRGWHRVPCCSSGLNVSRTAWDRKKKASDQISGAKNNPRKETFIVPLRVGMRLKEKGKWPNIRSQKPRKETFIVHRVWHAGPMTLQHPQRFQGGRGSNEKEIAKKQRVKKIEEKKLLLFVVDDMWDPWGSSILNVSKQQGIERKRK